MEANSFDKTENIPKRRQRRRKEKIVQSENDYIELGKELRRWNELKIALQLTDEDLATLLISSYFKEESVSNSNHGNRRVKDRFKTRNSHKGVPNHATSTFNLNDYGVYFPQDTDDIEADEISIIEDVFNINYGHDVACEKHSQQKQMTSPVPIHVTDPCAAARESAYLVYNSCLIQLANQNPPSQCNIKNCKADVSMVKKNSGTSIYFIWTCTKGHTIREWSSQPSLQGQGHLGDLMLASGIQMSGCNYQQVAMMLKIMNVECLNSESFNYFQEKFVAPKIISYWSHEQDEILSVLAGREVILLGGVKDRHGESAKYLTFSILDYETSEVLYISVVERKDNCVESSKPELQAFCKALQVIQLTGAVVIEVVMSIEPKINSYLKKKQPDITRSYDMWEGAKMIGKEIVEASCQPECSDLLPWLPDIISQFLDSSKTCAELSGSLWASTDEEAFKDSFVTGLIHHTMNNHQWISGECSHSPLSDDDKPWLIPDSPAHNQLKDVLLGKNISSVLGNFSTNRTTCGLETLMKYISVYTPTTQEYSFIEYRSRVYLAVLDYINHRNRAGDVDENGREILGKVYSTYTGQLETQQKKEAKSYNYLPIIVEKIVGSVLNAN